MIDLVNNLRGGGGMLYVPGRVLDTLLEPQKAMGLDWERINSERLGKSCDWDSDDDGHVSRNWIEWIGVLAGF